MYGDPAFEAYMSHVLRRLKNLGFNVNNIVVDETAEPSITIDNVIDFHDELEKVETVQDLLKERV